MTGIILRYRTTGLVAVSLLVAGCSASSSGTTSTESGSSGGTSSSGSSGGGSGASSGSSAGGTGDEGDDASLGSSSGSTSDDGGEEDAMAISDASRRGGGFTRDGSTPASTADASAQDAGTAALDAGDSLAAARVQCVQNINADRATLTPPSPPLVEDTAEEACVDGQAQADYTANTAHSAFGKCKESAQDECPGWPGPPSSIMTKCLAQMWAEGPPAAGQDNHWLNMSNKDYKKVACGFYETPAGKWWATQDFY